MVYCPSNDFKLVMKQMHDQSDLYDSFVQKNKQIDKNSAVNYSLISIIIAILIVLLIIFFISRRYLKRK